MQFLLQVSILMSIMFSPCTSLTAGKRFVLTGGPGVGKTSLIEELKARGYQTIPETYAVLYSQAIAQNTLVTFFADSVALYENILNEQLRWEQHLDGQAIVFLDRSTVDILAFAKHFNVPLSDEFIERAKRSYDLIFFLEPLPKDLYKRCNERKESYEEAEGLHHLIKKTYREMGFAEKQLIEVPFGTIQERIDFMSKKLAEGSVMYRAQQKDSNLVY